MKLNKAEKRWASRIARLPVFAVFLCASLCGAVSSHGAEPEKAPPTAEKAHAEAASPTGAKAPRIEHNLTVGDLGGAGLILKATNTYIVEQDRLAVEKLEKIRDTVPGTNQWSEVASILKSVIDMDASQPVKQDAVRLAVLQMAAHSERIGSLEDAQQYLAEYLERFSGDSIIPEVLLRQASLYRKMGAYDMAISKFYSVLTAAIRIRGENLVYYQRIVLTAQTQIAETQFERGDYDLAAELYHRLLANDHEELDRPLLRVKMLRALAQAKTPKNDVVATEAPEFLKIHPGSEYQAEVRYLYASALKRLGHQQEAASQLMLLLESMEAAHDDVKAKWLPWKLLAGNDIGNQFYLRGDYLNAVQVFNGLVDLDKSARWQLPLRYQIGLCYEHLLQSKKAAEAYKQIFEADLGSAKLEPSLQTIVEMARWRHDVLGWKASLEKSVQTLNPNYSGKTNLTQVISGR